MHEHPQILQQHQQISSAFYVLTQDPPTTYSVLKGTGKHRMDANLITDSVTIQNTNR